MTKLESLGFYDITKEPADPDVAELRRTLRDIEAACLRDSGPFVLDRDSSALKAIGQAVSRLFD